MEFIEQFTYLTLGLMGLIVLLTFYFHVFVYSAHTAHNAPSILTSLGIFGTFLGVALGLYNFDTNDIQASVPALIDGLKTAFWTSIGGLLGALSIKVRYALMLIHSKEAKSQKKSANMDDLAYHLNLISENLAQNTNEQIVNEMAVSRKENNEKLMNLSNELSAYQVRMTEANTKALVSAISEVMKDFNTKINEQYGQNFKELNESVGKMTHWQQENREHLKELTSQFSDNAELATKASQAFETLVSHSNVFNDVANNMEKMMSALHNQSGSLNEYLSSLANLVIKAQEGLPALEDRIISLTEGFQTSIVVQQKEMRELLEHASLAITQTVNDVNQNLGKASQQSATALFDQLNEVIHRNELQISKLDKAMENELTQSLKTFGYQLTALSEKFVNDYTPLTDRLQEVIRIAETRDD